MRAHALFHSYLYKFQSMGISMKSQRSGSGNSLYADVSPYPPIQVSDESWEYGNAMLSNMGSSNSEMSAISLYFYNQLLTDQVYDEISAIFENINKVEMHHLEIFGSLALRLGADPRLWSYFNGKKVYWTPGYNQYNVKLKE